MILRNARCILVIHLLYLLIAIEAQNARSYDTNDWIPITPSSKEKDIVVEQKKATGRVLNLDAPPQQKFFPDDEYRKKEKFLRDLPFPKNRQPIRQHKPRYERPYKFEQSYKAKPNVNNMPFAVEQPPPPVNQPQVLQQPPPYQAPQFLYKQQYNPNYLNPNQNYQEYQQYLPFNQSLYQTINPVGINQEFLASIQNAKPLESFQQQVPVSSTTTPKGVDIEKETVQLLYVPLENLKNNQLVSQDTQNVYRTAPSPQQQQHYPQQTSRLAAIEKDFIRQALEAQRLQEEIRNGRPLYFQSTTPKPKKRKAHQPPLAVYMGSNRPEAEIADVLDLLKDAKTIAVQDNFRPDSPKVFIGPSTLNPPDGYSKFPLPYLNSIEGNRIERKIEQLPFFVAPLSYKTPDGYSKIPLPSPHVGSVVVSTKDELHDKNTPARPQVVKNVNQYQYLDKPQYHQYIQNTPAPSPQKVNNNEQYTNPRTPEEVKQSYPVPARPQSPQLPPTLLEPVRQAYTLNQDESVKEQNIYPSSPRPTEYDIPSRSTTSPQITIDNFGQYHIPVSTLTPQLQEINRYSSTPQTQTQSFNLSDKVKASFEATPKPVAQSNNDANYEALSTNPNPIQSYNVNPLELAINRFELEQINSQLLDKQNQPQSSVYYDESFSASTPRYENNYDTVTTPKTKRRKPSRQPIRTTPTYDNTRYTVNEDYVAQRSTTPRTSTTNQPTINYRQSTASSEIENIPSKVYKLAPQEHPVYTENRPSVNQHLLNRETLDQHILNSYLSSEEAANNKAEQPTDIPSVEPLSREENQNADNDAQILSGYISNLQDQSVRALLVPNLLVPTTEQLKEMSSTAKYEPVTTPVEIPRTTEEPQIETTTRFRRNRGRVRGNSGKYSTTTSTPRRTVSRGRRPSHRITTEKAVTTTDKVNDYTRRSLTNTEIIKSRFRTRGRTTTTTENQNKIFKQPELQSGFQASSANGEPDSYTQFERTSDEQKIITVKPESAIKDYHQVYNLPVQGKLNYDNTPQPVVDIKITHPIDSDIITKPTKDSQYVQIHSGDRGRNSEEATRSPVRVRGRTRAKTRFPSTTTTTTEKTQGQEEFYGFFRQPDFNKPKVEEQQPIIEFQSTNAPIQYSSSYLSSPQPKTVYNEEFVAKGYSTERSELSSPVHFIGEIRPKYYPQAQYEESKLSIATAEQDPMTTERFTSRVTVQSNDNEVNSYTTKRGRTRSRGNTHYRLPETLTSPKDDAEVEGGNYPASFFSNKPSLTEEPFQITIDPLQEDMEDQSPHSSIYSHNYVKPDSDWVEASAVPILNGLPSDDKPTEEPVALPMVNTETSTDEQPVTTDEINESNKDMSDFLTEINQMVKEASLETTTQVVEVKPMKKKGRRRGVWKLVRHKPLDQFQTAESQNYKSVLNTIERVNKKNIEYQPIQRQRSTTEQSSEDSEEIVTTEYTINKIVSEEPITTTAAPTEGSLFDTLYDMFDLQIDGKTTTTEVNTEVPDDVTTTTIIPNFPQEITEEPATTTLNTTSTEAVEESTTILPNTVESWETTPKIEAKTTFDVDPWEMKAVKTSTSTEVSHETEICYKGRCVKSLNRKTRS
ncbi:unnamed protein product [Brassicogethes aeneus]|uniref:Uncharacterized protein n=1 Tax=Brassicogethes aeneus TaxID=1431903 RepID=A0A9P0B1T3_BRAAE|nr:unnamed protein product [Brassicogethes aeneus]